MYSSQQKYRTQISENYKECIPFAYIIAKNSFQSWSEPGHTVG